MGPFSGRKNYLKNPLRNQKHNKSNQIEKFVNNNNLRVQLKWSPFLFSIRETVLAVVEQLGGYKVQREVDTDTTHVVSAGKRRTVNVLKAILSGCWLLSVEWVLKSLEKGTWLNEEPFELAEDFPAAKVRTKNVPASTLEPELLVKH